MDWALLVPGRFLVLGTLIVSAIASESELSKVLRATTWEALRTNGTHDAIVVGAGAAGGLAAALLTEYGLRVLVLDAGLPRSKLRAPLRKLVGRVSRTLATPDGLSVLPPALVPKGTAIAKMLGQWRQPIQSQCMSWEMSPTLFVDDRDCPYVTPIDRPFVWVRVRMLGGRVAIPGHGRQYYRLGPKDFDPDDGLSPAWPLQPNELAQWYALVERRLQLSGMQDGLACLPDGEITNYLSFTDAESNLRDKILLRWPQARLVAGRFAPPLDSLETAARTGRLNCRQGAIVREACVDRYGRVTGIVWIDHQTRSRQISYAPIVFLCASALESTRILLLSCTPQNPHGLGAASKALGRYLMDHVLVSADGNGPSIPRGSGDLSSRCLFLPRFDQREPSALSFARGYGVQTYQFQGAGAQSHFIAFSFGEMTPRSENRITLDQSRRDAWGIPILNIDCQYNDAEIACARDQTIALRELADVANVRLNRIHEVPAPPGSSYHECGTARMGADPADSVLNPNNECWEAQGLYLTDAACFPSQGIQNPTLTILALTARACHHAVGAKQSNRTIGGLQPKIRP
jgi:choline dehydrogenase-like flavoprotein